MRISELGLCRALSTATLALGLVLAVGVGGCVGSQTTKCGAFNCPKGEECDSLHDTCIKPIQRTLCDGLADGDLCQVDGVVGFHCDQGICIPGRCGDGVNDETEECDDGAQNSDSIADACRTTCRLPRCGDGVLDASNLEACDDGDANSDSTPDACRVNCQLPRCGDAVADSGEECDDGNFDRGDGCGPTCLLERCGNRILDPGEECDDGNSDLGDGCGPTCLIERCGNGIVDAIGGPGTLEACDDGNNDSGDGCSADCRSTEVCGNGVLDSAAGEFCDDGNTDNGDGCSNRCWDEVWTWTTSPFLREANLYGMAFDEARGRIVAVGGSFGGSTWEYTGRSWERVDVSGTPRGLRPTVEYDRARQRITAFDGTATHVYDGASWREVATTVSPKAPSALSLFGTAMAWDEDAQRIVLFGGFEFGSGSMELDATWSFDGTDWASLAPTTTPPARTGHVMVNSFGSGIVMFGGCVGWDISSGSCTSVLNDTWVFQSGDWTLQALPSPPAGRHLAGAAIHPARNAIVLAGGFDATLGALNDVWELTLAGWAAAPTATISPARGAHAMAYDWPSLEVVLLGGCSSPSSAFGCSSHVTATQTYDGAFTTVPHARPPSRMGAVMAHFGSRHEMVLFGGIDDQTLASDPGELDDTWTHDGNLWSQATPGQSPPPRAFAAMVYDPVRDVIVLHGGCPVVDLTLQGMCDSADALRDTWEYDGTTWTENTLGTIPSYGRHLHKMVFDESRGTILMTGAGASTWEYDGRDWTQLSPSGMAAIALNGLIYDSRRNVVVAVGTDLGVSTQTWELSGTTWTYRTLPAPLPDFRIGGTAAYHPGKGTIVLTGGCRQVPDVLGCGDVLSDFWEYDGNAWKRLGAIPPGLRWGASMAYHPQIGQYLVFGGGDGTGTFRDDSWLLTLTAPGESVVERCHNGVDDDGDGGIDCADPDCAERYCGPSGTGCVSGYCD